MNITPLALIPTNGFQLKEITDSRVFNLTLPSGRVEVLSGAQMITLKTLISHNVTEILSPSDPQVIIDDVAAILNVPVPEIISRRRTDRIAWARQVAMFFMRESGMTFQAIADLFGKDHGTVIHACHTVINRIELDSAMAKMVSPLRDRIQKSKTALRIEGEGK